MLDSFVQFVLEMHYLGFFFYMILVGTFVPLPTQLILLPAGFLASQGKLDMFTVIVVSSIGTTIGATINYFLANVIAKKIVSKEKIFKIKKFFNKYGKLSVALAPLTFGLGQYISLPAGMAKMDLRWFIPLIFSSNALWNFSMLMIGYSFGEKGSSQVTFFMTTLAVLIIILISSFIYKEFKSY
jgi:membrane protein DedA with SNARE-associated domain